MRRQSRNTSCVFSTGNVTRNLPSESSGAVTRLSFAVSTSVYVTSNVCPFPCSFAGRFTYHPQTVTESTR